MPWGAQPAGRPSQFLASITVSFFEASSSGKALTISEFFF
jgi:hypothetical protein